MDSPGLPTDWTRAVLPIVVLAALARGEAHGYALRQILHEEGLENVTGSTLYPLLARQQELGRLGFRWEHDGSGPARKVFFLTGDGRDALCQLKVDWSRLVAVVESSLASDPTEVDP